MHRRGSSRFSWILSGKRNLSLAVAALAGQRTVSQPITAAIQNWQGCANGHHKRCAGLWSRCSPRELRQHFPPVQVYNAAANTTKDVMHFPNAVPRLKIHIRVESPLRGTNIPSSAWWLRAQWGHAGYSLHRRTDTPGSTIGANPGFFVKPNSLPKDCSLAAIETNVPQQDAAENIGRFVPMAASFFLSHSYCRAASHKSAGLFRVGFRNIFNYLTVQSSTDAYLPNVDPNLISSNPNCAGFRLSAAKIRSHDSAGHLRHLRQTRRAGRPDKARTMSASKGSSTSTHGIMKSAQHVAICLTGCRPSRGRRTIRQSQRRLSCTETATEGRICPTDLSCLFST